MMLQLSRSRPLPEKRIDLYQASVEYLLSARSDQGVDHARVHVRPEDKGERLRLAAIVAGNLQRNAYRDNTSRRQEVKGSLDDFVQAMPNYPYRTRREKEGFIRWLAEAAGILRTYQDDTLEFSHLSLQEYLASVWLIGNNDGHEERLSAWLEYGRNTNWWEALRLWAAELDPKQDSSEERVLDKLLRDFSTSAEDGEHAIMLWGLVLADGLGADNNFKEWVISFTYAVESSAWRQDWSQVANDWAACRQEIRRTFLLENLLARARTASWIPATSLLDVTRRISKTDEIAVEFTSESTRVMLTQIPEIRRNSIMPGILAFGRVFNGPATHWLPGDLPLLELWPSHRRLAGHKIQYAVLAELESREWNQVVTRSLTHDLLDYKTEVIPLVQEFVDSLNSTVSRLRGFKEDSKAHSLAKMACFKSLQISRVSSVSEDFFASWWSAFSMCFDRAGDYIENWGVGHVQRWVKDYSINFNRRTEYRYPYSLNNRPSLAVETWTVLASRISTLAGIDLFCRCLASSNSDLRIKNPSDFEPHRWIGRCLNGEKPRATKQILPIWQALGRYLARRDTPADRELLERAAREPESYPEPLCFGLQFIVRGDIMCEDGSIITLDELSNEFGLEPLPMIDPMPSVEMEHLLIEAVEQAFGSRS